MNHRNLNHGSRRAWALTASVVLALSGCSAASAPAAVTHPVATTAAATLPPATLLPAATTPPPATTTPTTAAGGGAWHLLVPGLEQLATPAGVVMRIDPRILEIALVPGTAEPGGTFPEGGMVPLDRRAALVMVTNAGFKRADARGGEMVDGRTVGTLVPGAASLVVGGDGTVDVKSWADSTGPGLVVVVQNLTLLVDHGQPAPDLGTNIIERWGVSFRPTLPVAIWRSAAGVDSGGRLLYVMGVNVVPAQLAQMLIAAGAVRGMQLDINHLWVFGALFSHPDPQRPEQVQPQPLLAGMGPTPAHVLAPGPRDFLAFYRRPPVSGRGN